MDKKLIPPVAGLLFTFAVTTGLTLAGQGNLAAFALLPLAALFWLLQRLPRQAVGLTPGRASHYLLALLHPLFAVGLAWLIAAALGATATANTDWPQALRRIALLAGITAVLSLVTEEGFFRGWLWASLRRGGQGQAGALLWSSLAFSLWHLPMLALDTSIELPPAQIPIYLANALLGGLIWGLLRQVSGSIVVPSLTHGLFNGLVYVLFGAGTAVGALGISDTALYGPDTGLLGLPINLVFALGLWWWVARRGARRGAAVLPAPGAGSPAASSR
jgi:membrane protease YdiL (CAAX protease family)